MCIFHVVTFCQYVCVYVCVFVIVFLGVFACASDGCVCVCVFVCDFFTGIQYCVKLLLVFSGSAVPLLSPSPEVL